MSQDQYRGPKLRLGESLAREEMDRDCAGNHEVAEKFEPIIRFFGGIRPPKSVPTRDVLPGVGPALDFRRTARIVN